MMQLLWISIRSEILKTKGSFVLWLSVVGTLANAGLFFLQHAFGLQDLLPVHASTSGWTAYIENHYAGISFMMLPLYVIILASLVTFWEHRTQTWTHLYTLPFPHWAFYSGKLLYVLVHFVLSHLFFIVAMLISGGILSLFQPGMGSFQGHHLVLIGQLALQTTVSILALLAFQFWISWRFEHFIIPLTVGILGFVGTTLMGAEWPGHAFNPYAYPVTFLPAHLGQVDLSGWLLPQLPWYVTSFLLFLIFWWIGARKR